MTANQLRYWELRWKQYYEYYYLEEQKRSNQAKEQETARHNRAQERIAKQELVLKRIELSQNQEKILQQWESLKITAQANYVKAALELRDQDRKAREFLESQKMAAVSMIVQYNNEQEKRQIEKFSAYANALDQGWTEAAVAKVLTEIESSNDEVNSLLSNVAKQYNLDIEVKGPQSIGSKIQSGLKDKSEKPEYLTEAGTVKKEYRTGRNKRIMDKIAKEGLSYSEAKEKYGPWLGLDDSQEEYGPPSPKDGAVSMKSDSKVAQPGTPSVATKSEGGKSAVIYSPGVQIASTSTPSNTYGR